MRFSIRKALQYAKVAIRSAKLVLDKGEEAVDGMKKEIEEHGPKENQQG